MNYCSDVIARVDGTSRRCRYDQGATMMRIQEMRLVKKLDEKWWLFLVSQV